MSMKKFKRELDKIAKSNGFIYKTKGKHYKYTHRESRAMVTAPSTPADYENALKYFQKRTNRIDNVIYQ